jgi:hypothetical protein
VRGSSRAPRRKSGRRGTAAGIDGQTRVCRRSAGKTRRGREEDRGEAGWCGEAFLSPGGHTAAARISSARIDDGRSATQELACSRKTMTLEVG